MRRRRSVVVAAGLVLTVSIVGCGGSGSEAPRSGQASIAASVQSGGGSTGGTTLEEDLPLLNTAEAADVSERIAVVRSEGSKVVEGQPGTPFTQTRFRLERLLKGKLGDRFVLQVLGGRLGDIQVEPSIRPFVSGHRYILFFGADGPAGPTITPQVRFEVKRVGGTDIVTPALQGIRTLVAGTSRPATALPQGGHRLDDVLFSIREYVRKKRAGP